MSRVSFIGRVITDPELKESARKVPYIRLVMFEQLGYGPKARKQDYHVWTFGERALELHERGVKKGSLLWVSGPLELVDYLQQDGITKDKKLKVKLHDWDYVTSMNWKKSRDKQKSGPEPETAAPAEVIDGERDALPE